MADNRIVHRHAKLHVPFVDPTRPMPEWLREGIPLDDMPWLSASQRHSIRYYRTLYERTPPWCTRGMIRPFYVEAHELRKRGFNYQVDHIIPLHPSRHGVQTLGLHVPANLQVIRYEKNRDKSNTYWPGMPWEQFELFNHPQEELDLR